MNRTPGRRFYIVEQFDGCDTDPTYVIALTGHTTYCAYQNRDAYPVFLCSKLPGPGRPSNANGIGRPYNFNPQSFIMYWLFQGGNSSVFIGVYICHLVLSSVYPVNATLVSHFYNLEWQYECFVCLFQLNFVTVKLQWHCILFHRHWLKKYIKRFCI